MPGGRRHWGGDCAGLFLRWVRRRPPHSRGPSGWSIGPICRWTTEGQGNERESPCEQGSYASSRWSSGESRWHSDWTASATISTIKEVNQIAPIAQPAYTSTWAPAASPMAPSSAERSKTTQTAIGSTRVPANRKKTSPRGMGAWLMIGSREGARRHAVSARPGSRPSRRGCESGQASQASQFSRSAKSLSRSGGRRK